MSLSTDDIIDVNPLTLDKSQNLQNETKTSDEFINISEFTGFIHGKILLKDLLNPSEINSYENLSKEEQKDQSNSLASVSRENIFLHNWESIENVSARLIETRGEFVILECLIDKENNIYEERVFPKSLFVDYSLEIGSLFYLRFFNRPHEMRLEVLDGGNGLVSEDDFPKINFVKKFKNSKLFKNVNI